MEGAAPSAPGGGVEVLAGARPATICQPRRPSGDGAPPSIGNIATRSGVAIGT
jgi:hypothetical protein